MKKTRYLKQFYRKNKFTTTLFLIMQGITLACLVRELIVGEWQEIGLCVLTMFLFCLPYLISIIFRVKIPAGLLTIVFLFIFSAEILGEFNDFYQLFPVWDIILHAISGFIAASVGFSLIALLNKKLDLKQFSQTFLLVVPLCFSLAVGAVWEMLEYSCDTIFQTDTQKDTFVTEIRTVSLGPDRRNKVLKLPDIAETRLYDQSGREIARFDDYLDIGLHDTLEDMFVNFIGAIVFGVIEYLYLTKPRKYAFVRHILLS